MRQEEKTNTPPSPLWRISVADGVVQAAHRSIASLQDPSVLNSQQPGAVRPQAGSVRLPQTNETTRASSSSVPQ